MRVLVCGGRKFDDKDLLESVLDDVWAADNSEFALIHGASSGADALANAWAWGKRSKGFPMHIMAFPADWRSYGKKAGPLRNQQMLVYGKPDLVLAFPGGNGTRDMVLRAIQGNVKIRLCGPTAAWQDMQGTQNRIPS